jgi:Tfp pilus assembly protein PilO
MTKLRQLWLLTALGSLAALAGGYFLLVSPQASKAAALRDEAETQLQANRQIQSKIAQLNKQKKDLPRLQAELEKFATKIPNNPAIPALIRGLSDAAEQSGVDLVSISPSAPAWSKAVNPATRTELPGTVAAPGGSVLVDIPVNVVVAGKYSQISQFFSELEALPRALAVAGFSIVPGVPADSRLAGTAATSAGKDLLTATIGTEAVMTAKPPAAVAPVTPPADAK